MDNTWLKSEVALLALLSFDGVGPKRARRVAEKFDTLEELLSADEADLKVPTPARAIFTAARWPEKLDAANQIIERTRSLGVQVLTPWEPAYPQQLKTLDDAPLLLYVRGQLRDDLLPVACIGTRKPTKGGAQITTELTRFLAEAGCTIVSGLALGIDTLAHRAALDCGGHTVAILANGLDTVYPRANLELAEEIIDQGGALLSEQPVGTPVTPHALVQRDRIQSGMSVGTVVMQTPLGGGSMQTVRYALTQKRLLFAPVPHGERGCADPANEGNLILTKLRGPEVAERVRATYKYREVLCSDFADKPPAIPILSRDEYETVLDQLRRAHGASESPHVVGAESPPPPLNQEEGSAQLLLSGLDPEV